MPEERRNKIFEWCFLATGILIQLVTYWIASGGRWEMVSSGNQELSPLSLISGCLGVCSICLCAQGRISSFVFGFAQVITYTYICLRAHLYGEVAINIYYFFTMIYGVYVWRRRLSPENENRIHTRGLPLRTLLVIIAGVTVVSVGAGWLLATYTQDPTPYLDAFTTLISIVAQLLMIQAYRDQWYLWFAVDIISVVMWLYIGDYCMTAQYAFWCCNCIFGYFRWRSLGISKV